VVLTNDDLSQLSSIHPNVDHIADLSATRHQNPTTSVTQHTWVNLRSLKVLNDALLFHQLTFQGSRMKSAVGSTESADVFIGVSHQAFYCGSFDVKKTTFRLLDQQLEFFETFFHFLAHIFDEKKSAQNRLKLAPIARTTSRFWGEKVTLKQSATMVVLRAP